MVREQNDERSWMGAVAFAEAGEWETARAMTPLPGKSSWVRTLEQIFMAVAFAEAGMPEEAKRLIEERPEPSRQIRKFLETVGLRHVRATYGVVNGASW